MFGVVLTFLDPSAGFVMVILGGVVLGGIGVVSGVGVGVTVVVGDGVEAGVGVGSVSFKMEIVIFPSFTVFPAFAFIFTIAVESIPAFLLITALQLTVVVSLVSSFFFFSLTFHFFPFLPFLLDSFDPTISPLAETDLL